MGCNHEPVEKARPHPVQGLTVSERFWAKVSVGAPNQCWPWTAGTDSRGYGRFRDENGPTWAHNYALKEKLGRPLLPGMETLHSCDCHGCCNPAHLSEGTTETNIRDMFRRGRAKPGGRAVEGLNGAHNHGRGRWPATSMMPTTPSAA